MPSLMTGFDKETSRVAEKQRKRQFVHYAVDWI